MVNGLDLYNTFLANNNNTSQDSWIQDWNHSYTLTHRSKFQDMWRRESNHPPWIGRQMLYCLPEPQPPLVLAICRLTEKRKCWISISFGGWSDLATEVLGWRWRWKWRYLVLLLLWNKDVVPWLAVSHYIRHRWSRYGHCNDVSNKREDTPQLCSIIYFTLSWTIIY